MQFIFILTCLVWFYSILNGTPFNFTFVSRIYGPAEKDKVPAIEFEKCFDVHPRDMNMCAIKVISKMNPSKQKVILENLTTQILGNLISQKGMLGNLTTQKEMLGNLTIQKVILENLPRMTELITLPLYEYKNEERKLGGKLKISVIKLPTWQDLINQLPQLHRC